MGLANRNKSWLYLTLLLLFIFYFHLSFIPVKADGNIFEDEIVDSKAPGYLDNIEIQHGENSNLKFSKFLQEDRDRMDQMTMDLMKMNNITSTGNNETQPIVDTTNTTTSPMDLDSHGRMDMGIKIQSCDDGRTNLTTDWDGSPEDYTCLNPEAPYPEEEILQPPLLQCVTVSEAHSRSKHFCMGHAIHYKDDIPFYGDHRPLWPKYGEYIFIPRQRWLHSIEHGAVVMLYHPCARPAEVNRLKELVQRCFGKHVITPSTLLPKERPLALVTWGCRYLMAFVDDVGVIEFINERTMKGPEGTLRRDGQYDFALIKLASDIPGSRRDQVTCHLPIETPIISTDEEDLDNIL